MPFNNLPGNILLPAGTTIVNGTYQIRQSTNPAYSSPKTAAQLLADDGISITTSTEILNSRNAANQNVPTGISFTEMDMQTGQGGITYPNNSNWFLKFNVQYPSGKVVSVVLAWRFSTPPIPA